MNMNIAKFIEKNFNYILFFLITLILMNMCISFIYSKIYNYYNSIEGLKKKSRLGNIKDKAGSKSAAAKGSVMGKVGNMKSKITGKRKKKNIKCKDPIPCNSNELALYKCLNTSEIENRDDVHKVKMCKNNNKFKTKTEAKKNVEYLQCKDIEGECDDDILLSYTCSDKDNDEKIKTLNDSGWSNKENIDFSHHQSCNESLIEKIKNFFS